MTTLDDFGSQGAWPTHPELLDWLASAVSRQRLGRQGDAQADGHVAKPTAKSSLAREADRQRDPANRWLARQSRFRLDAELVRDNALAISGLLSPKIGGPSVKPYQPAGYWTFLNFPKRDYVADKGENQYRRGLYTYWQRTFLHPSLLAFDASTREECAVERPRSNTPLQALVLLNDPTYVEAARVLGRAADPRGGQRAPRRGSILAYRLALGRPPTARGTRAAAGPAAKAPSSSTGPTQPRPRELADRGRDRPRPATSTRPNWPPGPPWPACS